MKKKSLWIISFITFFILWGFVMTALALSGIKSWSELISKISELNIFIYPFISLILTLLIYIVFSIVYFYYYQEKIIKPHRDLFYKVGYDITHLFSWLFSANGLLFLITCTIILLIIFVIIKGKDLGTGESQFIALTLSITLATIIPSFISKILAKGEIESIIDEKLNKTLDKFNTSLSNIRRDKAHASRMSAVLLCQMALQQKNAADKEPDDEIIEGLYQNAIKNAAWSIGWASEAIIQYLLIQETYSNAIERSEELLREYIYESKKCIESCRELLRRGGKQIEFVRFRDLKSLLTMHAIITYYGELKRIKSKEDEKIIIIDNVEDFLKGIEVIFFQIIDNNEEPVAHDCGITGMRPKFNKEIEKIAEDIIQAAKNEKNICG